MRRVADQQEQAKAGVKDRVAFVRFVTDPFIPRYCDPIAGSHLGNPVYIRGSRTKVVVVLFNLQSRGAKYTWEFAAKVAICEKREAHAARSYRTASSNSR